MADDKNASDQPDRRQKNFAILFQRNVGLFFLMLAALALTVSVLPDVRVNPWAAQSAALLSALVGAVLFKRPATVDVSELLIRQSGDPVTAYEKASQLFGLRGFLRTTNITGMPFATIAMTISFCVLAFLSHVVNAIAASKGATADIIPKEFPSAVLELAKLTLGAFIGSFVSRQ